MGAPRYGGIRGNGLYFSVFTTAFSTARTRCGSLNHAERQRKARCHGLQTISDSPAALVACWISSRRRRSRPKLAGRRACLPRSAAGRLQPPCRGVTNAAAAP